MAREILRTEQKCRVHMIRVSAEQLSIFMVTKIILIIKELLINKVGLHFHFQLEYFTVD